MKRIINLTAICGLLLGLTLTGYSQKDTSKPKPNPGAASKSGEDVKKSAAAMYKAHGGDKLKKIKSIVISGEADITSSDSVAPIKGSFAIVIDGDKGRFQIKTPFFAYIQVYENETMKTSIEGIYLPPINEFGFAAIPKAVDSEIAAAGSDKEKKDVDFYLTAPSGYTTAFKIDPETNLAQKYSSTFVYNGASNTTIVEIEKYRDIDGVLLPEKFTQKFDFRQMVFYVKYNAKSIETNTAVSPDVFTLNAK